MTETEDIMKKYVLTLLVILMSHSISFGSGTTPEFQVDQKAPAYPENRTVRDEISDFLIGNGFSEGLNSRQSGGDFFIAVGTGTIQAPRNSSAYLSSRNNAFEKAMLAAKKQMTEFIGVEIQRDLLSDYTEGENPALRKQHNAEAMASPDIFDKTTALVNAKLDKMLEEEGVDLSRPVPEDVVKKAVTSEVFEKFTRTAAKARVVGMQAMKVFEASPDGQKGQIGVIAVYSDKLHKMANALFSGNGSGVPEGIPKRPIREQLPNDTNVLLSTFGVQQKTDENGRLVLVAFGQGVPRTASPRSIDAAYEKAKMEAMGALRSFAGEIASVESDLYEFESVQEFEDGMEKYESESYYREKIQTHADALKISGITKVTSWDALHPLVNKKVAGVVIAWSPENAAKATNLGEKMAVQPKKGPAKLKPQNEVYQSGSNQGGNFRSSGAAADMDSF